MTETLVVSAIASLIDAVLESRLRDSLINTPLNILFLEQSPRFVGGSERIGLSLCTELHRLGHTTHLLYETEGDMVGAFKDVTATVICAPVRPLAVRRPLEAAESILKLRKAIKAGRVDVVFTSQQGYVSLLAVARVVYRTPSLVHLGLSLSFGSPLFKWAMPRIAATVTPSEPMRTACIALGWPPSRLHVVANGVDLQRFRPVVDRISLRDELGLPRDIPVIVYVGRLVREKGIFTLLRSAGILRQRGTPFHLVLVGESPDGESEAIASLAAELGLIPESFSLRGPTNKPESFFSAADAAIVPSEWPEPFGLTAIEAMACGTVPIVSDAGILPEIIGTENALCVFPQGNANELAKRIAVVLGDPGMRTSTISSCLARVRQSYGLTDFGRAYETILRSCVQPL